MMKTNLHFVFYPVQHWPYTLLPLKNIFVLLLIFSNFLVSSLSSADEQNLATLIGTSSDIFTKPLIVYLEQVSNQKITLTLASQPAQISSQQNNFEPAFQIVRTGSYIDIVNSDPMLHNTHIFENNKTLFNVATP